MNCNETIEKERQQIQKELDNCNLDDKGQKIIPGQLAYRMWLYSDDVLSMIYDNSFKSCINSSK